MSDNQNFGFGKFVPGFDFLQNLAKGSSQAMPQMTNLSSWVAPTLNLEELDKRIGELKAVHFWLDQNSKALAATIQALEVQKMTLATLKGMNFNMGEIADALKLKTADFIASAQKVSEKAAEKASEKSADAPAASGASPEGAAKTKASRKTAKSSEQSGTGVVDPLQWWGALTQQFQQIATTAMKDAAAQNATAKNMATGVAEEAMKSATGMAKAASQSTAGAARKPAAKRAGKKAGTA